MVFIDPRASVNQRAKFYGYATIGWPVFERGEKGNVMAYCGSERVKGIRIGNELQKGRSYIVCENRRVNGKTRNEDWVPKVGVFQSCKACDGRTRNDPGIEEEQPKNKKSIDQKRREYDFGKRGKIKSDIE
jgi:hypothetical protein